MDEDLAVHARIVELLKGKGIPYMLLEHEHVHTSEDAAKVRGTRLEEAAKALVLNDRTHDRLFMCVVSGHKKLDLKKIKVMLNSKDVSLAHPDDVLAATGCKVGTVPPFPSLFGFDGYCDEGVFENEYVVFSAASHYKSIRMKAEDWKAVAGVVVTRLAQD
jgi:Ala-tRNA(Pro) deacylase